LKELVSVLVPILNPVLSSFEKKILDHCALTLRKYSLIFVVSEDAEVNELKESYRHADFITFNEKYFASRGALASLFLMEGFYERFSWCEFLLIHELNSWVVKDELHYWCKQGYDFLKADPERKGGFFSDFERLRGLSDTDKQAMDLDFEGNGLFLCHIERFVRNLKAKKTVAHSYRHNSLFVHKDSLFWELEPNRFWPGLRRPTKIVQTRFSVKLAKEATFGNADRESWPFGVTGVNAQNINDLPYFE
jgi:hypothetical protein